MRGFTVGSTVAVYSMPWLRGAPPTSSILTPRPSSRLFRAVLGPKADQQSGRFPVAGDDELLAFGFAQKPRESSLISQSGTRLRIGRVPSTECLFGLGRREAARLGGAAPMLHCGAALVLYVTR
jgi:hypothetical protein